MVRKQSVITQETNRSHVIWEYTYEFYHTCLFFYVYFSLFF